MFVGLLVCLFAFLCLLFSLDGYELELMPVYGEMESFAVLGSRPRPHWDSRRILNPTHRGGGGGEDLPPSGTGFCPRTRPPTDVTRCSVEDERDCRMVSRRNSPSRMESPVNQSVVCSPVDVSSSSESLRREESFLAKTDDRQGDEADESLSSMIFRFPLSLCALYRILRSLLILLKHHRFRTCRSEGKSGRGRSRFCSVASGMYLSLCLSLFSSTFFTHSSSFDENVVFASMNDESVSKSCSTEAANSSEKIWIALPDLVDLVDILRLLAMEPCIIDTPSVPSSSILRNDSSETENLRPELFSSRLPSHPNGGDGEWLIHDACVNPGRSFYERSRYLVRTHSLRSLAAFVVFSFLGNISISDYSLENDIHSGIKQLSQTALDTLRNIGSISRHDCCSSGGESIRSGRRCSRDFECTEEESRSRGNTHSIDEVTPFVDDTFAPLPDDFSDPLSLRDRMYGLGCISGNGEGYLLEIQSNGEVNKRAVEMSRVRGEARELVGILSSLCVLADDGSQSIHQSSDSSSSKGITLTGALWWLCRSVATIACIGLTAVSAQRGEWTSTKAFGRSLSLSLSPTLPHSECIFT